MFRLPGDVARVALVLLADVDELGAVGEERRRARSTETSSSVSRAASEHVAGDVEDADRAQTANRVGRLVRVRRDDDHRARRRGRTPPSSRSRVPETGTLSAPAWWPAANASTGRTSRICAPSRRWSELVRLRLRRDERPAVQLDDPLHVRRARRRDAGRLRDEERDVVVRERGVEASLEADRRRRLRAHRLAAERPGDVTRVHLDAVAELDEPAERVEEALGALARLDREVGPRGVADEERVAGQDDPRARLRA